MLTCIICWLRHSIFFNSNSLNCGWKSTPVISFTSSLWHCAFCFHYLLCHLFGICYVQFVYIWFAQFSDISEIYTIGLSYYKVGRWAAIAFSKQYLWNGWTDLENRFYKKNAHIGEHTGEVWFHSVWWRHHTSKKGRCFFCPSVTLVLGYSSFISLENFGRKISGLLTPIDSFSYVFEFLAGNGRIWRKSGKRGFLDGQKQANMAIFVPRPQVSLTISQGFIIFSC